MLGGGLVVFVKGTVDVETYRKTAGSQGGRYSRREFEALIGVLKEDTTENVRVQARIEMRPDREVRSELLEKGLNVLFEFGLRRKRACAEPRTRACNAGSRLANNAVALAVSLCRRCAESGRNLIGDEVIAEEPKRDAGSRDSGQVRSAG